MILGSWACDDVYKMQRWEEMIAWARNNGCPELIEIRDEDFYYVKELTQPRNYETKQRPPLLELAKHLETLKSRWEEIVGSELASVTRPIAFTGAKARRLLVQADRTARPRWGDWSHLSSVRSERRIFTNFRASINNVISPHAVDHVDFTTE